MNKSAMELFVNTAMKPEEMLRRISHCMAVECFLFNLATSRCDETSQLYHRNKIRGMALSLNCMGLTIYVRHRSDMGHRAIEYFTISYNGEILIDESDFKKAAEEEL